MTATDSMPAAPATFRGAPAGVSGMDAADGVGMEGQAVLRVAKRDGRVVDFDPENIRRAVGKAFRDVYGSAPDQAQESTIGALASVVESRVRAKYPDRPVDIDEIQNLVEHALLDDHLYEVADSYKDYRWRRDVRRAKRTDVNEAVRRFRSRDKDIIDENANKDGRVYSTQRDLLAGTISKAEALRMLPRDVANAHDKGDIHYHDADYSPFTAMTNCSLPNFKDMLANGFTLGNAEMGSPHSIETAATQITQIMLDVASNQYGGQTVNRADELLAPYAKLDYEKNMTTARAMFPDDDDIDRAWEKVRQLKRHEPQDLHIEGRDPIPDSDDAPFHEDAPEMERVRETYAKLRTRKNIYDAMQTLEFQINSMHSSCGQTPFVTVGFGLGTGWFEREIQRCMFFIRIGGLGTGHRTAIFPKLTFAIKHGINSEPDDPNYDMKKLALECTSKRMYPDVLFYENLVDVTGSFKAPMGCRSFLQAWTNPETGLDEEEGRMNLGVVSVNMPRIAIESNGSMKRFWQLFDQRMTVAHHALQFRAKRCMEAMPDNAPSLWRDGAFGRLGSNGDVSSLMKGGRATISLGYIGLYETASRFYGKAWVNNFGWDEEARDFALSILRKMTDLCRRWESEEGIHYSVYGTPAESLTDRFSKSDREKFGVIPGITDHEFYTNSFHRPVWLSGMDEHEPTEEERRIMARPSFHCADNGGPFSKLDFECPFLKYTAGGHIVYTEEPRVVQNLKALEAVWDYAHDVGIDYLGTNTPIDRCLKCGYEGDFEPTETGYRCPECGNSDPDTTDVTKRVCGYLGNPVQRPMIHGRHEELAHRRKQMSGETGRITTPDGGEKVSYKDRSWDIDKT